MEPVQPDVLQQLAQVWWAILSVLVLGLTQLIKAVLPEETAKKFAPHIAAGIGMVGGYVLIQPNIQGVITGLMIGLGSSGLWSAAVSPFKRQEEK